MLLPLIWCVAYVKWIDIAEHGLTKMRWECACAFGFIFVWLWKIDQSYRISYTCKNSGNNRERVSTYAWNLNVSHQKSSSGWSNRHFCLSIFSCDSSFLNTFSLTAWIKQFAWNIFRYDSVKGWSHGIIWILLTGNQWTSNGSLRIWNASRSQWIPAPVFKWIKLFKLALFNQNVVFSPKDGLLYPSRWMSK